MLVDGLSLFEVCLSYLDLCRSLFEGTFRLLQFRPLRGLRLLQESLALGAQFTDGVRNCRRFLFGLLLQLLEFGDLIIDRPDSPIDLLGLSLLLWANAWRGAGTATGWPWATG